MYEVYLSFSVLIQMEYRDKLLWAETFWSLCNYMVWSHNGIYLLINISYCAMKILPYQDEGYLK
jgi:hypothetical protein